MTDWIQELLRDLEISPTVDQDELAKLSEAIVADQELVEALCRFKTDGGIHSDIGPQT